jgi:hypothetical protein
MTTATLRGKTKRPLHAAILLPGLAALLLSQINCSTCTAARTLDGARFNRVVASKSLRDSLAAGKLLPGMPYFIVAQIFPDCDCPGKRQVACVGCRRRIDDSEGWGRQASPPNLRIYYDEYATKTGKLGVWYRYPDFYGMEVTAGDELRIFPKDDTGRGVFDSQIQYLINQDMVRLKRKVPDALKADTLYGEVRYAENDRFPSGVSNWYLLKLVNDSTVSLRTPGYPFYPIMRLELNGEPVASFQWRSEQ